MKSNPIATDFDSIQKLYDQAYFEDGVVTGKSCYQNYRWMPELTMRMAFNVIRHLKLDIHDQVLDYGCSKGFMVKALRLFDIHAFGCDISPYAIDNVDAGVRKFCKLSSMESIIPFDVSFDWILTKDVMEHLSENMVDFFLKDARRHTQKMFHVIPLGDDGVYRVPNYASDPSHILAEDEAWWRKKFEQNGWIVKQFHYKVSGIKENWTQQFEKGNGFFVLKKR